MGETRYPIGNDKVVRFGYDDMRYGCLCTFPFNYSQHKLGLSIVESLALMGAVLCMSVNGGLEKVDYADDDEYVIPDCLPRWVRDEIRRVLGDYPEKFDEGEYDIDHVPASISDEDYKNMLIKRFMDIKEWAEQSIKDVENGDY
jgi:hypothetical protein